jgi:hypothetical protein
MCSAPERWLNLERPPSSLTDTEKRAYWISGTVVIIENSHRADKIMKFCNRREKA